MNPMTPDPLLLPAACRVAQTALEADALGLPAEVAAHLRRCPACSEARILLLALEDTAETAASAAPAGYFEGLPFRIQRKLPARVLPLRRRAALWLTAAALIGALGVGVTGFYMGRAVRTPVVEAAQPRGLADHPEPQAETPFAEAETEDALSQLSTLSPQEAEAALQRLQAPKPAEADPARRP